jgi:Transglutaminase-like superfamily
MNMDGGVHMPQFWIPNHVHVCIGDDIVWLDTRRDKYMSVAGSEGSILAQLVHGWPSPKEPGSFTLEDRAAFASSLEARGLVTRNVSDGKRYVAPTLKSPRRLAGPQRALEPAVIQVHHVAHVVEAYLQTVIALRVGKLHFAIKALQNRKAAQVTEGSSDLQVVRSLVEVFKRVRLYFYTPRAKCLFDSLVLMRFLFSYGFSPTCVIGVTVRPFHAHCWVQQDGVVWNSDAEFVSRFSPILVI